MYRLPLQQLDYWQEQDAGLIIRWMQDNNWNMTVCYNKAGSDVQPYMSCSSKYYCVAAKQWLHTSYETTHFSKVHVAVYIPPKQTRTLIKILRRPLPLLCTIFKYPPSLTCGRNSLLSLKSLFTDRCRGVIRQQTHGTYYTARRLHCFHATDPTFI